MPRLSRIVFFLTFVLVLTGCQSLPSVVETPKPSIPPLPAEIGQKREPNLQQRLLQLLSPSPQKETTRSGS